jgi:tetratricopeptide (TPR) repeat protein/TolB-like protein
MGTVYLALDRKHGRRVAIKVLPPDLGAAVGPERFLREIRIAARLNHPHILPLHDSGQAAGILYYVMPHVAGESLRARLLRDGRLPVAEALDIGRQIADALSYAHAAGVIHRDVTPGNILLAAPPASEGPGRCHALLADFGIAKGLAGEGAADSALTDSGLPPGTVAYASPEQAAGSRRLDRRTDIYSLGCVLYEAIAGGSDGAVPTSQILEQRFAVPLPPLHRMRGEVPPWVDEVLHRALEPNPEKRYATAGELRDALAGPAVGVPPPGTATAAPIRRRQLLWMTAGAAVLAMAAAALAFLPRRHDDFDPKRVVVAGFENRTGDSALAPVGDIAADYVARGLAATRLMHEVYDARAMAREIGDTAASGTAAGLALARRVGAGTVLTGRYYRQGDTLQIEAQLVDGATGQLIVPLEPSIGSARAQTRVVEILRQRVMAGFAVVLGSEFDSWKAASLPPTYEAYEEMLAGGRSGFDFDLAVGHFRRAAALDTGFTGAQTAAAVSLWLGTRCREVDSIARHLEPRADRLPPVDRAQLELAVAGCQGDPEAAVAAAHRGLEAAPRSMQLAIIGAVIAVEHLRPRDGLELLRLVDPEKLGATEFIRSVYWSWVSFSYHMLGKYREEHRLDPGNAAALAALGRPAEAERIALDALKSPHSPNDAWPVPMGTVCAALELRAHGHPDAARRVLDRVIEWYGTAVADATRDDFPCSAPLFSPFYYVGRWDEARAGYERMLAEDTASEKAHAALGALAVRRGDAEEAARMDAWLAAKESRPYASYARARMAVLRGDRDRAVALVRHAFDLGLRGRMFLHLDPDFESLREYPPYRDLVRPR